MFNTVILVIAGLLYVIGASDLINSKKWQYRLIGCGLLLAFFVVLFHYVPIISRGWVM